MSLTSIFNRATVAGSPTSGLQGGDGAAGGRASPVRHLDCGQPHVLVGEAGERLLQHQAVRAVGLYSPVSCRAARNQDQGAKKQYQPTRDDQAGVPSHSPHGDLLDMIFGTSPSILSRELRRLGEPDAGGAQGRP